MSAKEMLERENYYFYKEDCDEIIYKKKQVISDTTYIIVNIADQTVEKFTQSDSPFENAKSEPITLNELRAINKMYQEKGWESDK